MNAIVRKAFNWSSNGLLEIQWYLFAGAFLLGAAYTLLHNEHVPYRRRFRQVQPPHADLDRSHRLDLFFFLLPFCAMVLWTSVPWFLNSLASGETSSNAGGLILWPAKILVPIGFTLLTAGAFPS